MASQFHINKCCNFQHVTTETHCHFLTLSLYDLTIQSLFSPPNGSFCYLTNCPWLPRLPRFPPASHITLGYPKLLRVAQSCLDCPRKSFILFQGWEGAQKNFLVTSKGQEYYLFSGIRALVRLGIQSTIKICICPPPFLTRWLVRQSSIPNTIFSLEKISNLLQGFGFRCRRLIAKRGYAFDFAILVRDWVGRVQVFPIFLSGLIFTSCKWHASVSNVTWSLLRTIKTVKDTTNVW